MDILTPQDSPGFLMWHATLRWQRVVSLSLHPLRLTHVQFVLLAGVWWLTRSSGPPSQVDLAIHAGTDVKMTSQVIRKLEVRGLVTRTQDVNDSRIKRLAVTPAGAVLAIQAIKVVEAADRSCFGDITDLDEFLGTIRRLAGVPQRRVAAP
jgi:DNA-binding MarR family transcriptional regulator